MFYIYIYFYSMSWPCISSFCYFYTTMSYILRDSSYNINIFYLIFAYFYANLAILYYNQLILPVSYSKFLVKSYICLSFYTCNTLFLSIFGSFNAWFFLFYFSIVTIFLFCYQFSLTNIYDLYFNYTIQSCSFIFYFYRLVVITLY